MRWEGSGDNTELVCRGMQQRIVLYAAGEVEEAERHEVEAHVRECANCAAVLADERELVLAISLALPAAPDAHLLSQCRAQLSEALDQEEAKEPANWLASLWGHGWFGMRLAVSASLLLIVGFLAGRMMRLQNAASVQTATNSGSGMPVASSNQTAAGQAMPAINVADISTMPAGGDEPPSVVVRTQQPEVLQGTVNNDNVKNALLSVLANGQRYQPDVRLQSVELLKPRCGDGDVQQVMCRVLRTDQNPAVRLKALEALRSASLTPNVEQALLGALQNDSNPGVRVEAVNALLSMAGNGQMMKDPQDMQVLRDRMQRDPNNYVRLQTAALVQNLEPHQ